MVPFFFPLKAHLEKSYLSCFKTKKKKDITGINLDKDVKSFQYTKDYFIYLINSHILCNGDNHINFKGLTKLKPEFVWSNIDIITNDHLPFIGEIQENLYLGTGYNTWGNINTCLAGKILSDIILKKENEFITKNGQSVFALSVFLFIHLPPFPEHFNYSELFKFSFNVTV